MAREQKDIQYTIADGYDHIIEEKGNQTVRLRKLYYNGNDSNIKLDIRKWGVNEDGTERMGKGLSFLTDDGPHSLIEVMAREGYGNTKTILNNIKDREDFRSSLNVVLGKEDELYDTTITDVEEETSFYDPKCILY